MALSVLDGNQSATTLSSVVTGGEHIVAHTVVSLGSTAIANIASAVSGGVVSVSNFPASQSTTFGAVTGSVSVLNFPATQTVAGTVTVGNTVTIAGTVTANPTGTQTVAGTVEVGNEVTVKLQGINSNGNVEIVLDGGGIPVYPRDNSNLNAPFPVNVGNTVTVAGTVTVGNSVTIGSLPAIAGTVTVGNSVTIGSLPAIAGTVTANGLALGQEIGNVFPVGIGQVGGGGVRAVADYVGYYVPVVVREIADSVGNSITIAVGNSVTVGSLPAISGTVTVGNTVTVAGTVTVGNLPRGALTTHFGSVTVANTAGLTTAITNDSRKYLLLQNISTGAVTVGVGFVPTTTQGIALAAGAGLTFDAFCPTGAVRWLGATTGAPFTILEG